MDFYSQMAAMEQAKEQAKKANQSAQLEQYRQGNGPAPEYGKKQTPPPPNYQGLAKEQARIGSQYNRPNQQNAFGAGINWSQDANGNWTQTQTFGGPMGGLFGGLQGQAASLMGQPMDWNQFGKVGTGDEARNQAIDAAYTQAASRLDPMWNQREDQARTRLINQGFAEGSEGWNNSMGQLGRDRNDAYTSAMRSAIGQGIEAGDSVFKNNLMSQQNAIANALRQRGQPFDELSTMRSFMGSPDFMGLDAPNLLGAAGAEGDYWMQKLANDNSIAGSIFGGLFGGLGSMGGGMANYFGNRKRG